MTRSDPAAGQVVVGAVVVDSLSAPTLVLAARRTTPSALAGRWEFPGGKVESGERPRAALVRELQEELGVSISVGDEIRAPTGVWPINESMSLRLYLAEVARGSLRPGLSHDELRWLDADHLRDVDWLPADRSALETVTSLIREPTAASE